MLVLALIAVGADIVVGVEPNPLYISVLEQLLDAKPTKGADSALNPDAGSGRREKQARQTAIFDRLEKLAAGMALPPENKKTLQDAVAASRAAEAQDCCSGGTGVGERRKPAGNTATASTRASRTRSGPWPSGKCTSRR